ncbi:hypothetical protein [Bradyrhizobium retamae]|uniref:Uncharacterized protein n=1 Tax=Bradyrhizobium retamae TaxID=1300035 RepID=A0A0R3N1K0_9BRAD|nr:hypothetical protein [Bradyrhizobium retamae]KRR25953.1 hypothetical protein CQ13_23305 [Bradyrhizobium retamae]
MRKMIHLLDLRNEPGGMVAEKILKLSDTIAEYRFPRLSMVAVFVTDPCTRPVEERELVDQTLSIFLETSNVIEQEIDLVFDGRRDLGASRIALSLAEANPQRGGACIDRSPKFNNSIVELLRSHLALLSRWSYAKRTTPRRMRQDDVHTVSAGHRG